ncbi:MAG: hypothetical protein ACD_75C00254G0002 [uncultured bacterium]|nr:MAG: hypothetical protein ACD_75C00254G0002 [uncultured bacterium]
MNAIITIIYKAGPVFNSLQSCGLLLVHRQSGGKWAACLDKSWNFREESGMIAYLFSPWWVCRGFMVFIIFGISLIGRTLSAARCQL